MDYSRLAFTQRLLREVGKNKEAGLGSAVMGAVARNPGKALGTGLGLLGVGATASVATNRAKAWNAGFNPAVHQQLATPIE